ncbi:hypothetical protein R4447_16565 [Acinetobacter baumannii]|uniref:hypothetical protein n=1 Tax=Acinetobacter baumannii TaxID=470 RepID=UPI000417DB20|nr:hypothetical protein [Acinetobacter baumannii]EXE39610.1 hypothetical protein J573_0872 [Acinetobacter baumannii 1546444]MCV2391613.1 hypothetical protein [Acinetobacter baumannii]MDC4918655.1 hypothetical protein [Acinetobacter baumannii]MDC4933312.1 hypothetical protein [Acinetobacter baumannii]MDH2479041.1 hypothetical protein [Acinetobacter baumannii]
MSKNKRERKERYWQNFEILSIFLSLIFIAAIWKMYPATLLEIDEDNKPIAVASKPSQHTGLSNDEKKSYFEKIGEKYGTYGDAYGSLNTLFSGWAFALLLISLFMQRQELQAQRKELAAQRDEISKANDIAEQQMLITEQQADLLEKQIKEAQVQNFFNILFPLLNRKKTYYEIADELPVFGSSAYRDSIKNESTFKTLHMAALKIYDNFEKSHGDGFIHKDEILKSLRKMIVEIPPYGLAYSYLKGTQYKEYFLYIINFIEKFEGIDKKDKEVGMSIFLSDFSTRELYIISLLTIENEILMEKVIEHKVFRSFIEADRNGNSVFSLLFSE